MAVFLLACSPTKKLKEGQYLLYRQTVKGTDKLSSSGFTPLFQKKANKNFFGLMPALSLYNTGERFFDSSKVRDKINKTKDKFDGKIAGAENKQSKKERLQRKEERKLGKLTKNLTQGNMLMRMGEPPSIYDSALTHKTARVMKYHLLSQGFFEGVAEPSVDTSGKKISVIYHITEGKEFILNELYYKIPDKKVDSLFRANLSDSKIKAGERYNESNLTAEKERIFRLMKDNGYYDFSSAYIYFNVDTSEATNLKLQTVILNPEGKTAHSIYVIDSAFYITNQNMIDSTVPQNTSFYNGVYYTGPEDIIFSKKITDRKMRIHQGDIFRLSASEQTQKNLSGLDMYRTVGIRYSSDTILHKLTARVETNTMRRHQLSNETGFNLSQGSVPGPYGSISYRKRNAFGGFELLEINLKAAITGQAAILDPTSVLRSEEYSAFASIQLPQFYFPGFRNLKWENYNPKTKLLTGYTITRRPEYERGTAKLGLLYNLSPDRYRQIIFSPVDVNIINTAQISDTFNLYLKYLQEHGNNLIYGFMSSFVSDINASYIFSNNDPASNKKSRYVKYYAESGGTIFNLIKSETFMGLQTFKYLKFNTDMRYYFPVGKKNTFAMKFNIGMATPYGSNHGLPYEKYFFAGGPNSIRAWKLRRLGPGSYAPIDSTTGEVSYRIEQQGELLLETSYEYRFKIISVFEGAFFVDAGNVWMLTKDPARPGAQFKPGSFLNQIAVGTGAGLRLNLTFLIIRLDLGVKAYDPAVKKFVLASSGLKQSVLNIGIGYPF
ncbi:MAG: BamA/TamA family outer membrane protein [Cytophagaceae bacterium]